MKKYAVQDFVDGVQDPRYLRTLELVVRDVAIRRQFRSRRREGDTVEVAIRDVAEAFFLSEERVRAILYKK